MVPVLCLFEGPQALEEKVFAALVKLLDHAYRTTACGHRLEVCIFADDPVIDVDFFLFSQPTTGDLLVGGLQWGGQPILAADSGLRRIGSYRCGDVCRFLELHAGEFGEHGRHVLWALWACLVTGLSETERPDGMACKGMRRTESKWVRVMFQNIVLPSCLPDCPLSSTAAICRLVSWG